MKKQRAAPAKKLKAALKKSKVKRAKRIGGKKLGKNAAKKKAASRHFNAGRDDKPTSIEDIPKLPEGEAPPEFVSEGEEDFNEIETVGDGTEDNDIPEIDDESDEGYF